MRGHGRSGLRKLRAGMGVEVGEVDGEEGVQGEGGEGKEKRVAEIRDAGKRVEGTEGQPKNADSESKSEDSTDSAGSKKGDESEGNDTKKAKEDEKYDTYSGGYHLSRLAMDLHNLIDFLKTSRLRSTPTNPTTSSSGPGGPPLPPLEIVAVGCSIGAAILWTYIELFTDASFSGFVFVDQAPLQDRSPFGLPGGGPWDASKAHKGCYDERTMQGAQEAWNKPPAERHATHLGLVNECLGYRFHPLPSDRITESQRQSDEDFFTKISAQCPSGEWLAKLIADHTRYDHREACEMITKPVLVMGGKRSGCFSLEGMEEVVVRARRGGNDKVGVSWYESGHWLFWEESARFNEEVLGFVRRCWSE